MESESPIKIDNAKLVSYLTCPLCEGIFRCPYTINECMCTFCQACIYKYFKMNPLVDKCPKCQINIGGKPFETLIYDNSISMLVEILFPEFDRLDKEAAVSNLM
jgi:hypothetical protein